MAVVVVLPLVPVTNITSYPFAAAASIFSSIFKAILPGKLLPPLKRSFDSFIIIFDTIMLIKVLMFI